MKYTLLVILALVAAVVFSGQPAWSQAESGTIAGTVVDTTGAVIPGATVVSKSVASVRLTIVRAPVRSWRFPRVVGTKRVALARTW